MSTDVDVKGESGEDRALVKEFADVSVDKNLLVEVIAKDQDQPSSLAAIEVSRQN